MTTATLTSKGQITIPAEVREALGVAAGDRIEFVWKALRMFQATNVDFADCLIERSAAATGCEKMMTFDRGAANGAGMTLVT
jgi:AbrB family looped-hinge helix DNA binding protein